MFPVQRIAQKKPHRIGLPVMRAIKAQTLPAPYMRAMRPSKPPSAMRDHTTCSDRLGFPTPQNFLSFGFNFEDLEARKAPPERGFSTDRSRKS